MEGSLVNKSWEDNQTTCLSVYIPSTTGEESLPCYVKKKRFLKTRKEKKREGKGKKLTQNEEKQGHELRGEDREEEWRESSSWQEFFLGFPVKTEITWHYSC